MQRAFPAALPDYSHIYHMHAEHTSLPSILLTFASLGFHCPSVRHPELSDAEGRTLVQGFQVPPFPGKQGAAARASAESQVSVLQLLEISLFYSKKIC